MKNYGTFGWLICLVSCFNVNSAQAATTFPWTLDYSHSHLGFIGQQSGKAFEGSFTSFDVTINLNPELPEMGSIKAVINIKSATTGDPERDGYLPQPDWFDTSTFPQAEFISTQIEQKAPHSFIAHGTLTLKGISQPVTLDFSLAPEGNHWRAIGHGNIMRSSFHIGQGIWAHEDYVKNAVDVTFDLLATPQH